MWGFELGNPLNSLRQCAAVIACETNCKYYQEIYKESLYRGVYSRLFLLNKFQYLTDFEVKGNGDGV